MNIDRRRVLGPSNAYLPEVGSLSSKGDEQNKKAPEEVRKMFLKNGMAINANGSTYIEVGNTIIEVSVFGPRPIRGSFIDRASFSVECKFLPYVTQPLGGVFNSKTTFSNPNGRTGLTSVEQRISTYIETSFLPCILLEKYPKSSIDIFVTIISSEHDTKSYTSLLNLTAWATTCTALALVDAGIEIKDIVSSGHVRLDLDSKEIELDPISEPSGENSIEAVVSFMLFKNNEIVGIWIEGSSHELDENEMKTLVTKSESMAKIVRTNLNSFLLENVK